MESAPHEMRQRVSGPGRAAMLTLTAAEPRRTEPRRVLNTLAPQPSNTHSHDYQWLPFSSEQDSTAVTLAPQFSAGTLSVRFSFVLFKYKPFGDSRLCLAYLCSFAARLAVRVWVPLVPTWTSPVPLGHLDLILDTSTSHPWTPQLPLGRSR